MPYKSFAAVLALAASAALPAAAGVAVAAETAAAGTAATDDHRLTITVDGTGETDGTYELTCDPASGAAGGGHPDPAAACEAVQGAAEPFTPVSAETMCTYMYGGPATARIEGVWAGEPVQSDFSRVNGCEIARWDELVPALPELSEQAR